MGVVGVGWGSDMVKHTRREERKGEREREAMMSET
jgi:hypothetical protein